MSFGITKPIPQSKGISAVNASYDGPLTSLSFTWWVNRPNYQLAITSTLFSRSTSWVVKDQIFDLWCYQSRCREPTHFNFWLQLPVSGWKHLCRKEVIEIPAIMMEETGRSVKEHAPSVSRRQWDD